MNVFDGRPATTLLVLGGARSGKSGVAQRLVEASVASRSREPVFVATAHADDAEMAARIARHIEARDARWRTVEAPVDLVAVLEVEALPDRVVLVDCLTLWLSNVMLRGDDVEAQTAALAALVARLPASAVFVSNEVGGGIVPDNALARRFRDAQGRLNQAMATACDAVVLVSAGLPLVLKPAAPLAIAL